MPADPAVKQQHADPEPIVQGYRPLPGVRDEMMDADGRVRPHWQPFLSQLSALSREDIGRRFAAADKYLRDSGVFYRVYEDPAGVERPWPLSHIPLLIEPSEWRELEAGLVQRATLLEAVLADAYGPQRLVHEGRLPAALVAGNPEFLRPLAGVAPPGGSHLRFYGVDLGRGADGRWWVLSDRTQAPSGAGYALENRLALSRAIPDIYRSTRVERVAPFFQSLQGEVAKLNRQDGSRVCLLTPGPMNETYFEHAYLARYLGLLLVEGEDLTVRDDGVFIRTVSGLRRAEVLLRRLDADFTDPLELNVRSRLGVPGLVQAIRDGNVVVINSLGSGLVEARALLAFMPALAPVIQGYDLALPNVATWWLGGADVRKDMLEKFDDAVIAPALRDTLPNVPLGEGVLGRSMNETQRKAVIKAIEDRGADFVMQEAVSLSTMPAWRDGRLEPRPFTLRLFLTKADDKWRIMPGGFVRVADHADAQAVNLQHGGSTADAWVLSEGPVAETTLLPTPERMTVQRAVGMLPSRAADNLFWVGRYVERLEATLRLVRALLVRVVETDDTAAPVIAGIKDLLGAWGAAPVDLPGAQAAMIARAAMTRTDTSGSLPRLAGAARSAASVIRDRFSPDAWHAINDLYVLLNAPLPAGSAEDALDDRVEAGLRIISSFSGLAQENMTQLGGWRFLELGRRLERAILTCRFVRTFATAENADRSLDILLELADSQITYRQRYVMVAALAPVIDLIVLDPNNPRAVAYQFDRIEAHLAALPRRQSVGRLSPVQQVAAKIATQLRTVDAAKIDDALIADVESGLMSLSHAISSAYLTHNDRSETVWEAIA